MLIFTTRENSTVSTKGLRIFFLYELELGQSQLKQVETLYRPLDSSVSERTLLWFEKFRFENLNLENKYQEGSFKSILNEDLFGPKNVEFLNGYII